MEEFIKVLEQILYLENFKTPITVDLKIKFLGLFNAYAKDVPEKYVKDVQRLKTQIS